MELFSLTNLIKNIQENFNGINYFLISSPYIDVTRTQRLDTFMSHFENSTSFKLFERITEKKGNGMEQIGQEQLEYLKLN